MDDHERVIDGVLHRREGAAWVPMDARELTVRLLEARRGALAAGFPLFVWPAPERQLNERPAPTAVGDTWWPH